MSNPKLHYTIRPANYTDAREIYYLIRQNSDNLVPRSLSDVVMNIDRFLVAVQDDGTVIGAAGYSALPEIGDPLRTSIEIQSVCVDQSLRRQGIGRALVVAQLKRVRHFQPAQIVVLTFTPPFFAGIGFREVPKASLMHKLYMGCINCTKHESPFTCPEVAMVLDAADIAAVVAAD